jgi:hypothetical protein
MMTSSPCRQFTGVATLCVAVSCSVAAGTTGGPQLGDLAGHGRGRRLVQQPYPLRHLPFAGERHPLQRQRGKLEVGFAQRASDRPRAPCQAARGGDIVLQNERDLPLADRKPTMLRGGLDAVKQPVSALEPPFATADSPRNAR